MNPSLGRNVFKDIRTDTPFVLDSLLVEWNARGNSLSESLGILSIRKWVSWMHTIFALSLWHSLSNWGHFSVFFFRPLALMPFSVKEEWCKDFVGPYWKVDSWVVYEEVQSGLRVWAVYRFEFCIYCVVFILWRERGFGGWGQEDWERGFRER